MHRLLIRAVYFAIGVALCVGAIRLALVATKSESGWSTIASQWQEALFGRLGAGYTAIGDREPIDQAEFWLAEMERLRIDDSESASMLMGAAWMLDSPGINFIYKHVEQKQFPGTAHFFTFPDEKTIASAIRQFQNRCQTKCLEYADLATELEPNDVRWWRMRAMLLFEGNTLFTGLEFEPRQDNWIQILDDCIVHDPDNALYDYLAAIQLWSDSCEVDWPDNPNWPPDQSKLTIHDQAKFDRGTQRFSAAQKKPFLAVGESGYPAIAEFVDQSSLYKSDQADTAVSRMLAIRQSHLFLRLWRSLEAQADHATQQPDLERNVEILKQCLRLYEQAIVPAETTALSTESTFDGLRRTAFDDLMQLAKQDTSLVDSDEVDSLMGREIELRTRHAALLQALSQVQTTQALRNNFWSLTTIASGVSCVSVAALLWCAFIALVLSLLLRRQSDSPGPLGIWRHALAWFVGYGTTFVVLGLAPAEVISRETQTKACIAGVWIAAFAIVTAVVWWVVSLLRRGKLRFRLISLFAVMTSCAIFAALLPVVISAVPWLKQFPPELWLPAKGWSGIDAEVLRNGMSVPVSSLKWAIIQWLVHAGLLVGLAISLAITAAWFAWRTARSSGEGLLNYWTRDLRNRWSTLFRFTFRSAVGAAVFWFLLYLYTTPELVRSTETLYQLNMRYCRDPHAHWSEIAEARKLIESTPASMQQIQSEVESSMENPEMENSEDFIESPL